MTVDVVDIDHIALRVSDLDASLAFYHDLLGLDTRDEDRGPSYPSGTVGRANRRWR